MALADRVRWEMPSASRSMDNPVGTTPKPFGLVTILDMMPLRLGNRNWLVNEHLGANLQTHYTQSTDIIETMVRLLGDITGKRVLEPSVGDGALIRHLRGLATSIDAVDVITRRLESIPQRINFWRADFISLALDDSLFAPVTLRSDYHAAIANPPYGLKLSRDFRSKLKKAMPDFYVRESYGLFIKLCLDRLAPGGRYVFIVPDTFLTSANHKPLRKFLLRCAMPSEIILFPTERFETVNFAYGNLCIIAGNRDRQPKSVHWMDLRQKPRNRVQWDSARSITDSVERLADCVETAWAPPRFACLDVSQSGVVVGDLADCRTGIYTGDNSRFLGFDPRRVERRTNGHAIDWERSVRHSRSIDGELSGDAGSSADYVPLIRGGHRPPFSETAWAIRWDQSALRHYKTDPKARFQNSSYYFRRGIAVPMVTSNRLTASRMSEAVFDQGVVGVFSKRPELEDFLLLYFNWSVVSTLIKPSLCPGSNNSAAYLRRFPVPSFGEEAAAIASEVVQRAKKANAKELTTYADSFFEGSPNKILLEVS